MKSIMEYGEKVKKGQDNSVTKPDETEEVDRYMNKMRTRK